MAKRMGGIGSAVTMYMFRASRGNWVRIGTSSGNWVSSDYIYVVGKGRELGQNEEELGQILGN